MAFLPRPRFPKALELLGERRGQVSLGFQDVWAGALTRQPFLAVGVNFEVVSDSANNATGGTGARSVRLLLMDNSFVISRQTVALNGVTPVAVPGGPYMRCLRMRTVAKGSYGFVQSGQVRCQGTGGGTEIQAMDVDTNQSRSTSWTFNEEQHPWGITGWRAALTEVKKNATATFEVQVRNVTNDEAWQELDTSFQLDDDRSVYANVIPPVTSATATDIFDLRISFEINTAAVFAEANVALVINEPGLPSFDDFLG